MRVIFTEEFQNLMSSGSVKEIVGVDYSVSLMFNDGSKSESKPVKLIFNKRDEISAESVKFDFDNYTPNPKRQTQGYHIHINNKRMADIYFDNLQRCRKGDTITLAWNGDAFIKPSSFR